jgi:ATP-binding cassette, subfamily B, bacterial
MGFLRELLRSSGSERQVALGSVLLFFAHGAMLLAPVVIKFIVDDALQARSLRLLTLYLCVGLGLHAFGSFARYAGHTRLQRQNHLICQDLRAVLFSHLETLSYRVRNRRRTGELASQIFWGAYLVGQVVGMLIPGFIQLVVTIVGTACVLAIIDLRLALLSFVPLPIVLGIALWLRRKIGPKIRRKMEGENALYGLFVESIAAISRVLIGGGHAFFSERLSEKLHEHERLSDVLVAEQARVQLAVELGVMILLFSILGTGGYLAVEGTLELGTVVVFYVCVARALGPLRAAPGLVEHWQRALTATQHIQEILHSEDVVVHGVAHEPKDAQVALCMEQVSFGYDRDRPIMEDMTLEILSGQRVAILGPSGAGKSTLLKLFMRICDPNRGAVKIFGVDTLNLDQGAHRAWMGIVPQDVFLFQGTLRENILLGLERPEGRVWSRTLALSGLDGFVADRGEEAEVGPKGVGLSGGQMRRVAMARCLLRRPSILLLDQFASDLGDDLNRAIFESIRSDGPQTILYVGHRIPPGFQPDVVYWMEAGRLTRQLDPEEKIWDNPAR